MSIFLIVAALAPQLDASRLVQGQQCYEMLRGGEPFGFTRQDVEAVPSVQGPAWQIRIEQIIPANRFRFVDTFLVRQDTLAPIAFHSVLRGEEIARLLYLGDRVVGWKKGEEAVVPVDVAHDEPVLEGNLWGLTLSSLPLEPGFSTRIPVYQYHRGLTEFVIDVTGEETIDTPSGPREVWHVALGHSPEQRATYLMGKDDGVEYGYRGPNFVQAMMPDCAEVDALDGSF